jgi:hypothetical protein
VENGSKPPPTAMTSSQQTGPPRGRRALNDATNLLPFLSRDRQTLVDEKEEDAIDRNTLMRFTHFYIAFSLKKLKIKNSISERSIKVQSAQKKIIFLSIFRQACQLTRKIVDDLLLPNRYPEHCHIIDN